MSYQRIARVTVRRDADGLWRWSAQGPNWRVVETSPTGTKRKPTRASLERRFRDAEIVFP